MFDGGYMADIWVKKNRSLNVIRRIQQYGGGFSYTPVILSFGLMGIHECQCPRTEKQV